MTRHLSFKTFMSITLACTAFSAFASQMPAPPVCGISPAYKHYPRLPDPDTTPLATPDQLEAASQALTIPANLNTCSAADKAVYQVVSGTCQVASVKSKRADANKKPSGLIEDCTTFYNNWIDGNSR